MLRTSSMLMFREHARDGAAACVIEVAPAAPGVAITWHALK
jgi:hypothetical protein